GPVREAFMQPRARPLQDALVGRVANKDVLEPEAVFRLLRLSTHELLLRHRDEVCLHRRTNRFGDEFLDGRSFEGETDHRRRFDHSPLLRREEIESCCQERLDRWRYGELRASGGGYPGA